MTGGAYFKHFISFCFKSLAALQHLEPVLEGVFWLQGESDTSKAKWANAYYDNLIDFVGALRTNLGVDGSVPFIASEIVWKSKQTKKVNKALRALQDAQELEGCYCVDGPDRGVHDDGHLNAESVLQVGERMASAFIAQSESASTNLDLVGTCSSAESSL